MSYDAPAGMMWQSYGRPWKVLHHLSCYQLFENVHEVTTRDGTLVARFCSECDAVTYEEALK